MRKVVVLLTMLVSLTFAQNPVSKVICPANPSTTLQIVMTAISTIYNVFPIKIGSMTIMNWNGLEDIDLGSAPICICMKPFPRVGINISLWEPIAIVEPVKVPWCSPTLGMQVPVPVNAQALGADSSKTADGGANTELRSLQVHYYRFLPWALLELFMDFVCLEARAPWDIAYMTELDPLWQNDILASIIGPEAFLVANPVAQLACMADAVASSLGFPIDVLFWCGGSWGSLFPMSENAGGLDSTQSSGLMVARMLFKLHRELILWGSFGQQALCGYYPMPLMRKSQYNIYPIYPILYPKRFPIGRSSFILWGLEKEIPGVNRHVWAWMVYRKRDCCAF